MWKISVLFMLPSSKFFINFLLLFLLFAGLPNFLHNLQRVINIFNNEVYLENFFHILLELDSSIYTRTVNYRPV
jgi:hypothetical protein